MRRLAYRAAVSWWQSLALLAMVGLVTGMGAGVFASWRLLSESGPIAGWGCTTFMMDDKDVCHGWHTGWGYGPTAAIFALIAWSVVALVVVLRGPGE